jgi:TonB family protein
MFLRLLAPRRPAPAPLAAPLAGPLPGTALSLTAHAALIVAAVGGDVAGVGRGDPPAAAPGERLQWVGVREGVGTGARTRRPGARAPVAYVVPGTGALRVRAAADGAPRPGPDAARRAGRTRAGGAPDAPAAAAPRAAGPAAPPPAPDPAPRGRRPAAPALRLPPALLAAAARAEADAAVLVAGVLAAAPDFSRPPAPPEEFVARPAAHLVAELMVRVGVVAGVPGADLHARDLPIPLINNPAPAYPASLARAGVGGRVVVEFRVDSTGAIDLASYRLLQSTDARFADAVRAVLPRLHFAPALSGERATAVTVRQPFLFTMRGASGGE